MTRILNDEAAEKANKRARVYLRAAVCLMAAATAVNIVLCRCAGTLTEDRNMLIAAGIYTLCGWAAILMLNFRYLPGRAEAAHLRGLENETEVLLRGTLIRNRSFFHIPRSVDIEKVTLRSDDGDIKLNILKNRAFLLPGSGAEVTLAVRRGYIVGIGENNEAQ